MSLFAGVDGKSVGKKERGPTILALVVKEDVKGPKAPDPAYKAGNS
jgi:hypothetical protein